MEYAQGNLMIALLVEGGNAEHVKDYTDVYLSEDEKNDHVNWHEPRITNFNYFLKEVETWKKEQSTQCPLDSISNVSSRSTSSGATSAAKIASGKKAALVVQSTAFKDLHALKLEETMIKSRMGKMEFEAQIVAADTKIKVRLSHDEVEPQGDAINAYYGEASKLENVEPTLTDTSTLVFVQVAAVHTTQDSSSGLPYQLSGSAFSPQQENH